MHTFKEDFYGEILNVAIVGYLRPEKNFDSLGKFCFDLLKSYYSCFTGRRENI